MNATKIWLITWTSAATIAYFSCDLSHVLNRTIMGPEIFHPAGFDAFGRDLLAITLSASFRSLILSLVATILFTSISLFIGAWLGLLSSALRKLFLRVLDFFLAFPSLLIALSFAAIRGPGWDTLFVALGFGIMPSFSRLVYTRTRELLSETIAAAHSMGATPKQIFKTHLIPALLELASLKAPQLLAHTLLAEATLSFLGIGVPVGQESWGTLIAQGKDYLLEAPHIAIAAGLPLFATLASLQSITYKNRDAS